MWTDAVVFAQARAGDSDALAKLAVATQNAVLRQLKADNYAGDPLRVFEAVEPVVMAKLSTVGSPLTYGALVAALTKRKAADATRQELGRASRAKTEGQRDFEAASRRAVDAERLREAIRPRPRERIFDKPAREDLDGQEIEYRLRVISSAGLLAHQFKNYWMAGAPREHLRFCVEGFVYVGPLSPPSEGAKRRTGQLLAAKRCLGAKDPRDPSKPLLHDYHAASPS